MKKAFVIFLTLCLLLCGCGGEDPVTTTAGTTAAATTQAVETTPATTAAPETTPPATEAPETTPPTTEEVVLPYQNPLTGEGMAQPQTKRPIAVVVNNIKAAQPQHGISDADMICEILAEGGITRTLALFSDVSKADKIGSVRSARTYLIDLARAFDAPLIHAGGSSYALNDLANTGWTHYNALGGGVGEYFYRDQARKNAGYAYEHTLFTSGDRLGKMLSQSTKTLERDVIDYGFTFAQTPELEGDSANEITVRFLKNGKKTTVLTFNAQTGLYEAVQHGKDYVDGNTNEKVAFRNVLVIQARTTYNSEGRQFVDLVATGNGWYACDGKVVPIKWTRTGDKKPFVFTLTDGTPLTMAVGKSYMAVIPGSSEIQYQ